VEKSSLRPLELIAPARVGTRRVSPFWHWILLGASTLSFGAGCAATQLIVLPDVLIVPPENPCVTVVERVEHLDDTTELGFSSVELLQHIGGAQRTPMLWLAAEHNEEYQLDYAPEHGDSALDLVVTAAPGGITYEHPVRALFAPEDTECGTGTLKVPVSVQLRSQGQALDETFVGTLEATVPYRAHLSASLAADHLGGSLTIPGLVSLDPERHFQLGSLGVDAELWQGGSQGALSAHVTSSFAKPSSDPLRLPAAPPERDTASLAAWPTAEICEGDASALPPDAKVMGFSAADVLAVLSDKSRLELAWTDGSMTPLDIVVVDPGAALCQSYADALEFDATLRLHTADGRLDTARPVHVAAQRERGGIGEITVTQLDSAEPLKARELGARALDSLDMHDYHSFVVEVEASYRGTGGEGSLSVRGVDGTAPDGSLQSTLLASGRWTL
jgi:hypothetical protein